ncbi:MAG: BsuPI-related putative proteinase inhibitor [Bacillota bacterium]
MFTHEVQTGETLEMLAQRFDTTVEEILDVNEIRNPDRIPARTVIRIPAPILPPTVISPKPFANFAVRQIGSLLYIFSTDRLLYRRTQPVCMTLVKINISGSPITLTYPTTQRFDFIVRRGVTGPIVWRWSTGRVFAQVVETVVIPPGQSQIFTFTWDQIGDDGRPVAPGIYTVQAENVAQGLRGQRVSVRIRIM